MIFGDQATLDSPFMQQCRSHLVVHVFGATDSLATQRDGCCTRPHLYALHWLPFPARYNLGLSFGLCLPTGACSSRFRFCCFSRCLRLGN